MIRMATHSRTRAIAGAEAGEPIREISVFRYPGAIWRRYDRWTVFPRLPGVRDAICSTNPI